MIPPLIVPFRMVRTEYLVMLALPAITSFNPMVLVESNRLNLLRLWLCAETRVLRFDLLHLLRIGLLPLGPRFGLRVWLAGCRSCAAFSRRLLHTLTLLPLLNLLLLPLLRRHSRRMTGNIRSRRWSIPRFLVRAILPAFSSTGLIRRFIGRFTGDVRFRGVRRFVARVSFLPLFRARLIRSSVLICRAAFLHRAGLFRWPLLRLDGVRAGLCLSRVRFFRGALALCW